MLVFFCFLFLLLLLLLLLLLILLLVFFSSVFAFLRLRSCLCLRLLQCGPSTGSDRWERETRYAEREGQASYLTDWPSPSALPSSVCASAAAAKLLGLTCRVTGQTKPST